MKVIILAAGYATRLYPLTVDTPKCLLTVAGKTILDAICGKINEAKDVDEIIIVSNARFYEKFLAWQRTAKYRTAVRVLNDGTTSPDNRLGAIGDLNFTLDGCKISGDILMMASDNLFDAGLGAFIDFARAKNAPATGLHDIGDPMKAAGKYGVLETDASGRVVSIEEKPAKPRSSFIGMGIYFFPGRTLPLVKEYLASPEAQDAPGHYLKWLTAREKLYGFIFKGMWYDIGDLKALEEADQLLSKEKK